MRIMIAAAMLLSLSGCYSLRGPSRVLDADRQITKIVPNDSPFSIDFRNALVARRSGTNLNNIHVPNMLSSGFAHIYGYCDNYFDVMGVKQRQSRIARSAIAPISALITGVLALQNFQSNPGENEDLLAILGLATGGAASALDIYDEHMLFGAENIGSVETLIKKALDAHSQTVLGSNSLSNGVSFDAATRHLLDNQAICSPQQIILLAREAIKEGKPAARSGVTGIGTSTMVNGVLTPTPTTRDPNAKVEVEIDNSGGR